jgi:uncharacterized protein (TIRG00374 family)
MGAIGSRQLTIAVILILLFIGVAVILFGTDSMRPLIGQTDWRFIGTAIAFVGISYAAIGYGFVIVARFFSIRLPTRDLMETFFVSMALNHVVATAGIAGFSVRTLLLRKRAQTSHILAASLFHSSFNNLVLFSLLPFGLVYMFLHRSAGSEATTAGLAALVLILFVAFLFALLFSTSLRQALISVISRLLHFIGRNLDEQMKQFERAFSGGIHLIKKSPASLLALLGLVVSSWTVTLAALWMCFAAVGVLLSPGILLTGFAVGVTLGMLSMIPGGLGVQEGSMAATYAFLGIALEQALLAAILFRVVYYFIPFLASLGFYARLLRHA